MVFLAAPAHAQQVVETYVDLSVEVAEINNIFGFTARNHGTAVAYGVTIDIELADQAISVNLAGDEKVHPDFEQKSGSTCSGNIVGTTCVSGVFPVGALKPGEEKSFWIVSNLAPGLPCCTNFNLIEDYRPVPARAVVKNTLPVEEERFKGNNTDTGWMMLNGHRDRYNSQEPRTRYWLEASVDDPLPDAGETVSFTFKAHSRGDTYGPAYGVKVRLKLDDGMGTPNRHTSQRDHLRPGRGLDPDMGLGL